MECVVLPAELPCGVACLKAAAVFAGGAVTINQDMKALRCEGKLEVEYLFWCLNGFAKVFSALAQESAHRTRKMEAETLKKFRLPVPPLPEQAAIAAALELRLRQLDQLAEATETTIDRLTEYRPPSSPPRRRARLMCAG